MFQIHSAPKVIITHHIGTRMRVSSCGRTNATTAATKDLSAGTYTISTAVRVATALFATGNANTSTTVSYEDVALVKPN